MARDDNATPGKAIAVRLVYPLYPCVSLLKPQHFSFCFSLYLHLFFYHCLLYPYKYFYIPTGTFISLQVLLYPYMCFYIPTCTFISLQVLLYPLGTFISLQVLLYPYMYCYIPTCTFYIPTGTFIPLQVLFSVTMASMIMEQSMTCFQALIHARVSAYTAFNIIDRVSM